MRSVPGIAAQVFDANGRVVLWDEESEKLYGFSSAEMRGERLGGAIMTPEAGATFEALVRRTLASGVPAPARKWHVKNKKGERLYVLSTLFPARLESGELVAVCADDDITGDRQAEEERHLRAEQFRALVEHSPDVIARIDRSMRILYVNAAIERTTGRSPSRLIGQTIADAAVTPEFKAMWIENIGRVIRTGQELTFEFLQPLELGAGHFEVRITPEFGQGGDVRTVLAVARDVTRRHELESQLAQAQKMESIGHLAGGIAHDFNNLLTVILGYTDVALQALGPNARAEAELRNVQLAAQQAAALTQQLLAFARQQVLTPQVVDLGRLVASTEALLRQTVTESIELVLDLAPEAGRIRADPGQLQQVLLNLAINARDAMPRGGRLTIATRAVTCTAGDALAREGVEPGDYLRLDVTDTGTGMTGEVRAQIFEPFFTTKEKGKGTGLGLSTCYGIVRQSRGWIFCESAPGRGTRFTILLPVVSGVEEEVAVEPAQSASGGHERVLLAEDDDAVRALAASVLRSAGYDVREAASARAALELAERGLAEIDLLVTDVVMPGMSGVDLARTLRRRHPRLKVLFTSGYPEAADLQMDRQRRPLDAHLPKPFVPATLAGVVRELLDRPIPREAGPGR